MSKLFASRRSFVGILAAGSLIGAALGSAATMAGEGVAESVAKAPATHKQTAIINAIAKGEAAKLEDFCLAADGKVLALVGPAPAAQGGGLILGLLGALSEAAEEPAAAPAEADAKTGGAAKKPAKSAKIETQVRVFDAAGKQLSHWLVGFPAEAINVAPDGTVLVGGQGKVARFSADGKKLQESESPQMVYIREKTEEMRERAKEQLEAQKAMVDENIKVYEEQLKTLTDKKQDELTDEEKNMQRLYAAQVQAMKTYGQQVKNKTIEQAMQEVTSRALETHSICASKGEVFIVVPAMAGYGYGVWRTDAKLGNAKEIVKDLRGCCGQMDVQCHNDVLFVSENSRHRVAKFDREGKELGAFGKRDREGEGENFGGCCNPMNLCFTASGNLYVAESNGAVKHFTPDGKFVGMVGVASVQPGCKNSCVAATADDKHLFYIDIQKSQIIVLAKQESPK